MANTITFNTSGLIGGTTQLQESYYKFTTGTGVLAVWEDSVERLSLTADSDGNPATFKVNGVGLNISDPFVATGTGVITFLDTSASSPGPESWTADLRGSILFPLLADSNRDGLADGFMFPDSNQQVLNVPLTWHVRDANNDLANFSIVVKDAQNNDITFSGSFRDTNNDNQPDRFVAHAFVNLDMPILFMDTNGDGQSDHFEMYGYSTRNGRVQVDSAGNPAGIYLDDVISSISSATPSNGDTNVAVDQNIELSFDEAIQKGSGTIALYSGSSTGTLVESFDAASSTRLSISGNTLTINPSADLGNGINYFVILPEGVIKDLSGNTSVSEQLSFTTTEPVIQTDTTAPTVISFNPADGVTGVATGRNVIVNFSETIQKGTGSITIRSDSATGSIVESYNAATSTNLNVSGNTLTINPTDNLAHGTHYFVTFDNGSIRDLAGNNFAGTSVYDFTTTVASSATPPSVGGQVAFWKTGAAIEGVTSTLGAESMVTGVDGYYHHLDHLAGNYTMTTAKNVTGTSETSAVKANDALAALKIAVGVNPNADSSAVSPYQYLAADVNKDGAVKASDALSILKMAVGLGSAPEKEWLFVPESVGNDTTMTRSNVLWPESSIAVTLDNQNQELHLIGIVKGDVNGSWAA